MVETQNPRVDEMDKDLKNLEMWNKFNKNSKLNDISDIIKNATNKNVKQLMNYIVNQDYRGLQKAVGHNGAIDGKLGTESLKSVKYYAEKEDLKKQEKKELDNYNVSVKDEEQKLKQEIQEFQGQSIEDLGKYKVRSPKGEEKEMRKGERMKENGISVEINNKEKTIKFQGILLVDGAGAGTKIPDIKDFYWIRTNKGIEIYSNYGGGEELPRLKIGNDGVIEGRSNPISKTFDIKLDGKELPIFNTLKVELVNKFTEQEYPKTSDGLPRIENKFLINKGNVHFPGLKLFNNKTQKWENIPSINRMYMKRDKEKNLTIYSSEDQNPKMILKPNGIVKGVLWDTGDTLNYGAKKDTELWKQIWNILNDNYNKFSNEKGPITYDPRYVAYETGKSFSNSIAADGEGNNTNEIMEDVSKNGIIVSADGRGNSKQKLNARIQYDDLKQESYESYNDNIPQGVMKNSIKSDEYEEVEWKNKGEGGGSRNGEVMYQYNIKGENGIVNRIGGGFSKIENNKYEVHKGFMVDLSQKKLYLKNMSMNENNNSNWVLGRDRVFDFSDIVVKNNLIEIKGKDVNHIITRNGYTTSDRTHDNNWAGEIPWKLLYQTIESNSEKFV